MRAVVASWNVHGWVGTPERPDPASSFAVIRSLEADVVLLQEVEGSEWLEHARAAGYHAHFDPTREPLYGNAILSREALARPDSFDLSVGTREPRRAVEGRVRTGLGELRILCTHFGLGWRERRHQAQLLARHLAGCDEREAIVLAGDFNDWTPGGRQLTPLARVLGRFSRGPTFPSQRPLLSLDRALWRVPEVSGRVEVVRSEEARRASDHLPLRLSLER